MKIKFNAEESKNLLEKVSKMSTAPQRFSLNFFIKIHHLIDIDLASSRCQAQLSTVDTVLELNILAFITHLHSRGNKQNKYARWC